jgi:hypothetical protein
MSTTKSLPACCWMGAVEPGRRAVRAAADGAGWADYHGISTSWCKMPLSEAAGCEAEEAYMRIWMLGAAMLAASTGLSGYASAQATAETVLTHGLASTAGTSIGTALGGATNQLAGRVGQQASTTAPRPQVTVVKGAARTRRRVLTPRPTQPASGSLIASIQGGERQESSCPPQPAAGQVVVGQTNSPGSKPQQTDCKAHKVPAVDAHPSVVNLPAPK